MSKILRSHERTGCAADLRAIVAKAPTKCLNLGRAGANVI